jgi:hypothetical protein
VRLPTDRNPSASTDPQDSSIGLRDRAAWPL